ncbi:MAG: hypothetical protein EB160_08425, partial [Nitrososphaeria archaeon]|nr:hypothetical protein [Nitrososphaeria archaeon]
DVPESLRSRIIPTAKSPYIFLAARSRDFSNIKDLNKRSLLADREQELKRIAQQEQQNLQAVQNGKASLPTPKKEVKK